jgi:prevent-host-death family protein
MKRASITEAKNRLSSLIERVRHGETVVIEDRGVPVARLESVLSAGITAAAGRVARLQRQGIVRGPKAPAPKHVLDSPPPRLPKGTGLSAALLAERDEGR